MKPHIFLLIPVVLIAGCAIPGTDINIPLPWEETISLENDIIIIKNLDAIPDKVTAPQQIRLIASIENRGRKEFSADTTSGIRTDETKSIRVELFDYCQGLFEKTGITASCPDGEPQKGETTCRIRNLLPKEIREVKWTLIPNENTRLITPCELKVSVSYPYRTSGLTTIHFINSQEYADQLARGVFRSKISTTSLGDGPVKVWYEVKDKQPIPAASAASSTVIPVNLNIDNKGAGSVQRSKVTLLQAENDKHSIFDFPFTAAQQDKCPFRLGSEIPLIQDERELPCLIRQLEDCKNQEEGCVAKETTYQLTAEIEYLYEFRKNIKVTVNPGLQIS